MKKFVTILFFISCFKLFSQTPVVLWEQGFGDLRTQFYNVLKTNNGEFILNGHLFVGDENLTVRIDTNNQLIWEGNNIQVGALKGIVQQSDGYIYSVKNSNPPNTSTFSLFQYNDDGVLLNQWSYPHSDVLYITKLVATQDGGFLISGYKTTPVSDGISRNGWVAKLNASKVIEWEREISSSDAIQLQTATQTTEGNFLVAGYKEYNNGTSDFYLAKLNTLGNLIWEKEYGGSENEDVWAVTELVNGNYIFAGASTSFDGDVSNNSGVINVWTIITDTNGNLLSEQIITNGFLAFTESSIIAEPDGGYTIGTISDCSESSSMQHFNIQRFNAANENIWNLCLAEGNLYDIVKTDDDGYIAVGSITSLGINKAYAIKIGVVLDNESFALQNTSFYPNPVKDILHIKSDIVFNHITVYTVDGRKVMREQIQNNQINVEKLPQNLYIAKLVSETKQEINLKFVKN